MNDQVKEKIKKCLKQYAEETGRPTGKGLFKCFNPGHDEKKASMQFKETYYKCYGSAHNPTRIQFFILQAAGKEKRAMKIQHL